MLVVVTAARTPSTIGRLFRKWLVSFQDYPPTKPKMASNTTRPMRNILDWRQAPHTIQLPANLTCSQVLPTLLRPCRIESAFRLMIDAGHCSNP